MSPDENGWWGPKLARFFKTVKGLVVIATVGVTGLGGTIAFVLNNAEAIGAFLDLPGRALRHEMQDNLLFELASAALARDSAQESRTLYYYRAMHCIHDGYEDTSEFLDCPHFREEFMAALRKAEGRAGPGGTE